MPSRYASSSSRGRTSYKKTSGGAGNNEGRRFLVIALVVVLLLGGVGYLLNRSPLKGEEQAAVCALLVDRTGSTESELNGKSYRALATKAIDGCREARASLFLFWFDQTEQKLVLANDEPYLLWEPKRRTQRIRASELEDELAAANGAVDELFDTLPPAASRRSDILTALGGTADTVRQAADRAGVEDRFVIVLSDGIQLSDAVTVEALTTPASPVAPLVKRAADLRLIPALDDIHVDFAGVNGGVSQDGKPLTTFFDAKVEEFWSAVVAAGGGELCYIAAPDHLPIDC